MLCFIEPDRSLEIFCNQGQMKENNEATMGNVLEDLINTALTSIFILTINLKEQSTPGNLQH